MQVLGAAKIIM